MSDEVKADELSSPPITIGRWASQLSLELETIDQIFDAHRDNPRQRYGAYLCSLSLLTDALPDLPGFKARFLALEDLVRRLESLAAGQKHALLPLEIKKGRPEFSSFDWGLVGRSAAAVEFLIRRGIDAEVACDKVAKALHRHGVKGRRGAITRDTVMDWREGVADGSKAQAISDFDHYLDMFTALVPVGIGRDALINRIGTLVRPFGSSRGGTKRESF